MSNMLVPTIVMGVIAVILLIVGYRKGGGEHITGAVAGVKMGLYILPMLFFAFIVAGMVQVLVPADWLATWVGHESGLRGILIGTVAGGLCPGGPYVSLPIAAGLLSGGAGMGTMVAFLTSWSLWAVARLPMEVSMMGWQFTLIRLAATFFFPPIAGLIANGIARVVAKS